MGRDGFSLVEVLVGFIIITIAGVGLFSLGSMSTTSNNRSADQAAAIDLAVAKLEELKNFSFDTIPASGSDGPWTAGGASGGIYARSWTVTSTALSGLSTPTKTIAVTVSWPGAGPVSVSTLVVEPSEITPGFWVGFPTAFVKSWDHTR